MPGVWPTMPWQLSEEGPLLITKGQLRQPLTASMPHMGNSGSINHRAVWMQLLSRHINQSINYTFPALWLGVSKEIVYFCPPSLSILSQPCPRWQYPKGIQILSDIICPALHWPAPATLVFNAAE